MKITNIKVRIYMPLPSEVINGDEMATTIIHYIGEMDFCGNKITIPEFRSGYSIKIETGKGVLDAYIDRVEKTPENQVLYAHGEFSGSRHCLGIGEFICGHWEWYATAETLVESSIAPFPLTLTYEQYEKAMDYAESQKIYSHLHYRNEYYQINHFLIRFYAQQWIIKNIIKNKIRNYE